MKYHEQVVCATSIFANSRTDRVAHRIYFIFIKLGANTKIKQMIISVAKKLLQVLLQACAIILTGGVFYMCKTTGCLVTAYNSNFVKIVM